MASSADVLQSGGVASSEIGLARIGQRRCINRVADGGLGLPPKMVQERLGHSSIMMTMDVYGQVVPARR
ncbi:hypothetical protein BQ8794_20003 [Mesorhizobium prunaredense]|uniref:Tyr recombinase domain-containing protein n=1 Tax=Mesorhizobium prunaredense TaxID=1631249 RepID=A0A1R3V833_9HYPH|nr:hypothetical protein BQ8794_20003 [Mesorhizobium prunaredense]